MKHEDIAEKLDFYNIDSATKRSLNDIKPTIESALPHVLTDFYKVVKKFKDTNKFFSGDSHMDAAKSAQVRHWSSILEGSFSDNYINSVTKIGQTHARIGLEPGFYIGGYSFIITEVINLFLEKTKAQGMMVNNSDTVEEVKKEVSAFVKAALLDMDFAIGTYIQIEHDKVEAIAKRSQDFLETSVFGMINTVAGAAAELSSTARLMDELVENVSYKSNTVAAAAEQATANVTVVAASSEEMSASIREISHQVSSSAKISSEAVSLAENSVETVRNLSTAADKIGEVVSMISEIASQTNLLALNATIESARAGEAGKGFAVVASEVKNLAGQTSRATDDISKQINEIQASTQSAVDAIGSIRDTINSINNITVSVNAAIEEQSAVTSEIARNTQEASTGSRSVSIEITDIQTNASETSRSASQVVSAAEELSKQSEALKTEVQNFINSLKAA